MFAVAKFLASRGRTGSKRFDSVDSVTTLAGGDKDVVKITDPLPALVVSEVAVVPDKPADGKPEPQPTETSPPPLASGTQSEVVSSEPTEDSKTSPEDTPKPSTWTGDENDTVVHEPEETQSLETKVESKPPSERQGSSSSSLHDGKDLRESTQDTVVEPSNQEGEQKDDKPLEPLAVPEAKPISDKESSPIETEPTHADPQEPTSDSQDLIIRKYQTDLEAALSEKEGLTDENRRIQENLRNALNAVDDKTEAVNRLLDEVEHLKENIRVVTLAKEEELLKAETERVAMGDRMTTEMEDIRRASKGSEETARKETQRVKGIIAVERHSHSERVKEFRQENEELSAELEAVQSAVLVSATQIESLKQRIRGLEDRLEDSRQETRELYDKYHEQENTMKQLQEEILEERDEVLVKDGQIQSVKVTNESLSTSLVEVQSKANRTERQNKMLLEQVRQQSDQLQNQQYTDIFGTGLGRFVATNTLSAFSSLTRGIRRGAATARADSGIKTLKQVNDEIFQLAASLTDQLEGIDKRFVSDDSLSSFAGSEHHEPIGVRRVKAEYLKSILGLELIKRLEKDAAHPMKDINPFYVQVALQGCLTACCMRIITSWYPTEWDYGRFLEVLYERIRGTGGADMALNWRRTTQQNCVPLIPRDRNSNLVDYLKDELRTVLSVSGWTRKSDADAMIEGLREKLFNLVSLALRLNTMTATGVPGELEPILVERDSLFDWREMGDDCAPDRSKNPDLIPIEETVVCSVALGLKWSDGSDVDMPRRLLKPRVVLDSAIVV